MIRTSLGLAALVFAGAAVLTPSATAATTDSPAGSTPAAGSVSPGTTTAFAPSTTSGRHSYAQLNGTWSATPEGAVLARGTYRCSGYADPSVQSTAVQNGTTVRESTQAVCDGHTHDWSFRQEPVAGAFHGRVGVSVALTTATLDPGGIIRSGTIVATSPRYLDFG